MAKRFGDKSVLNIEKIVSFTMPENTKKSKKYIWRQFEKFCQEKNYILDENLSVVKIAAVLADWAFNMRKEDGTEYKESVVKLLWNSVAKLVQENYYKNYGTVFDPFKDVTFKLARDARNSKRRQLQQIPEKRKTSSAAITPEEHTKIVKLWDEDTPIGLQRKFYYLAALELAWRGGEASKCILQHFHEEVTNTSAPTGRIAYNTIFSKTAQGGDKRLAETKWLVTNTENPNLCPVR